MNADHEDEIWRIRARIARLESVKDEIVAFLTSRIAMSDATKSIWSSDVKELYHNTVAAWEMLNAATSGEEQYAPSCESFLWSAGSRVEQVASELRSLDTDRSRLLDKELSEAFENCRRAIREQLDHLATSQVPRIPERQIVRVAQGEYHFHCAVCSKVAAQLKIEDSRVAGVTKLTYQGIVSTASLDVEDAGKLDRWLRRGEIGKAHAFVRKYRVLEDGLDAYCPECDKVYCKKHYNVTEEWDEGFYDYATGTCPQGHRRIIDD